jgi:hypothetical protein
VLQFNNTKLPEFSNNSVPYSNFIKNRYIMMGGIGNIYRNVTGGQRNKNAQKTVQCALKYVQIGAFRIDYF